MPWRALVGDPTALAAVIWLLIVVAGIIAFNLGAFSGDRIDLKARNLRLSIFHSVGSSGSAPMLWAAPCWRVWRKRPPRRSA